MRKYKFLGQYAQSNILSCKGSSCTFVPEKIYNESEMIDMFVSLHPNRWKEEIIPKMEKVEIVEHENKLNEDVVTEEIVNDMSKLNERLTEEAIGEYYVSQLEMKINDENIYGTVEETLEEENVETDNEIIIDPIVDKDESIVEDTYEGPDETKLDQDIINFLDVLKTDVDPKTYLTKLHWKKVKQIAEYYNVEWDKMSNTILAILKVI